MIARRLAYLLGFVLTFPARVVAYLARDLLAGPDAGVLPFTTREHRQRIRKALRRRPELLAFDIHDAARFIPHGGKVSLLVALELMVADGELEKYYSATAKAYKYSRPRVKP